MYIKIWSPNKAAKLTVSPDSSAPACVIFGFVEGVSPSPYLFGVGLKDGSYIVVEEDKVDCVGIGDGLTAGFGVDGNAVGG